MGFWKRLRYLCCFPVVGFVICFFHGSTEFSRNWSGGEMEGYTASYIKAGFDFAVNFQRKEAFLIYSSVMFMGILWFFGLGEDVKTAEKDTAKRSQSQQSPAGPTTTGGEGVDGEGGGGPGGADGGGGG